MENIGIVLIGLALVVAILGLRNAVDNVASKLDRIGDMLRKIKDNTTSGR